MEDPPYCSKNVLDVEAQGSGKAGRLQRACMITLTRALIGATVVSPRGSGILQPQSAMLLALIIPATKCWHLRRPNVSVESIFYSRMSLCCYIGCHDADI